MTGLNITVPLSSTRAGYDPETAAARYAANSELIKTRYFYEKFLGKRKSDGAKKLNELKPEHKQYVACAINGMKGVEIAEQFNVAAITVYRVLADPLAQALIGEFDDGFKAEFKAMFPLVSDAVRTGLESANAGTRLKAVDRWAKICKFIDGGDSEEPDKKTETIFAARLHFVKLVKAAVPGLELVEAEVVEATREVGAGRGPILPDAPPLIASAAHEPEPEDSF